MKTFPNRFDVACSKCAARCATGQGFTTCVDNGNRKPTFTNFCRECVPVQIVSGPRLLTSDGKVIMPFEPANLPLVKSLPGARWNPTEKVWTVSLNPADRKRILEVADRIGLEVAPSLREVEQSAQAKFAKEVGLYDFQVEGVNWLAQKKKSILGDEMGLGKTAQALLALPINGAGLVICRAGLIYNWRNECQKWRKDLTPVVIRGNGNFRFPVAGELVIINSDILPAEFKGRPNKGRAESTDTYFARLNKWREEIRAEHPDCVNTHLIIDEAHDFKNRKAARTRKVREIAFICDKVTGLTGSPLSNRPEDLFGVLDTIGVAKEVFGTYERFQQLFHGIWNGYAYEYGKPDPIVPELLRRVMIRRKRDEVMNDLPTKRYTNMVVESDDPCLKEKLDRLWTEWESALSVGELPRFEEFAAIRADLAASRIPAMLEYIEDCEEQECPLLVFSSHLAPLDALIGRPGWATISGDTKPERRQQIVDEFQAGRLKGVGITIRAGGVGLTLTQAAKALFVDMDWTPAANWQAEDRICRIGQKRPTVEIIRMVSDHPLDLHVQRLLVDKIDTIVRSIDDSISGKPAEFKGETEEEFAARMARLAQVESEIEAENKAMAKQIAKSKVSGIHERESKRFNSEPLPLTPQRADQVRQAFSFMLGVCDGAFLRDGQGFNKPDASVAHCLLNAGLETQQELEAGFMILSRYHRQLSDRFPLIFRNP